ncbi:MAG: type secretion system protein VirB2 [Pseudomonadota bacterium]|jgi:type IV secretion system protein VirB2
MKELRMTLISVAILFVIAFVINTALAELALAQSSSFGKVDSVLTKVKDALTGPTARILATIAVAIVGLMWMFGQMDFKRAGSVIVGIGIVFGAAEVVAAFG